MLTDNCQHKNQNEVEKQKHREKVKLKKIRKEKNVKNEIKKTF